MGNQFWDIILGQVVADSVGGKVSKVKLWENTFETLF